MLAQKNKSTGVISQKLTDQCGGIFVRIGEKPFFVEGSHEVIKGALTDLQGQMRVFCEETKSIENKNRDVAIYIIDTAAMVESGALKTGLSCVTLVFLNQAIPIIGPMCDVKDCIVGFAVEVEAFLN